ncbi:MAG: radical SAM protein [Dehalococcoidia bacterium]|nr:radical SAM protein [Dehalococcoidia bacterium]
MKVFLLNPPYVPNFIRSSRCTWKPISGSNWYPIFLAYCAGLLQEHGHHIRLVDAPVAALGPQETFDMAGEFGPDLTVVYTSHESYLNDLLIAEKIKELTGGMVVLVGPVGSRQSEAVLAEHPAIDGIVRHEFEKVVLAIAEGADLKTIPGLISRSGNEITSSADGGFLSPEDLDRLPFVTKVYEEHLPIRRYRQASLLYPFVDLFTSRGCAWGRCTFCVWPQTIHKGGVYRKRSLGSVIEEFTYVAKCLPFVREVFLQDDMLPAGRARDIAEGILRSGLHITWSAYAKAELDFETLALMQRSGCRFLHVGYESSNATILRRTKKGITPERMVRFTRDAHRAGIKIHGDFIIGLPGETQETIKETIIWAKKLGIEAYQFVTIQPHPQTELYHRLNSQGLISPGGEVSYPHLSSNELSYWRFKAMRSIYLRPRYLGQLLSSLKGPSEYASFLRAAFHVLPNILFPRARMRDGSEHPCQ